MATFFTIIGVLVVLPFIARLIGAMIALIAIFIENIIFKSDDLKD